MTAERSFITLVGLIVLGSMAWAEDWPQWRGPNRDGVWSETGVLDTFPAAQLQPVWSAPVGAGYSGPTVVGERVFVTDHVAEPEEQERVHCFDRRTGKALWSHAYPRRYISVDYALGPRAAVTVVEGRAYSFGAMGDACCLDVANGSVVWQRDLADEYRATVPVWGLSAAPLVVGEVVIYQIGAEPDACLVALDVANGREKWRALSGRASYSAPKLIVADKKLAVLAWTGAWLASLDPATGKVHWQLPFQPSRMVINVPDPVLDEGGGNVFLTSFYDGSSLYALKAGPQPPELRWQRKGSSERRTDALHSMIMTPMIRRGHVYGVDSYGQLRCLNLETGDRVWSEGSLLPEARWATAFFVQNGDRTWITTESGEIIIAKLTPEGFERLSSAKYLTPTTALRGRDYPITWSHPAYAQRCLFARSDTELICISLAR